MDNIKGDFHFWLTIYLMVSFKVGWDECNLYRHHWGRFVSPTRHHEPPIEFPHCTAISKNPELICDLATFNQPLSNFHTGKDTGHIGEPLCQWSLAPFVPTYFWRAVSHMRTSPPGDSTLNQVQTESSPNNNCSFQHRRLYHHDHLIKTFVAPAILTACSWDCGFSLGRMWTWLKPSSTSSSKSLSL